VPLLPKRIVRRVSRLLISALSSAAALLSVLPSSATTVVALYDKRHHRIVLAADSLVERYYAETSAQECKLIVKPDCAFAMAGFLNKPDPYFHLQDLADQACELPGTLLDRADAFLKVAQEPVATIAQYLHDNEPKFYNDTFSRNGGEFAIVVFAGTEHGKPVAYARGFKIQSDGSITVVSNDIDGKKASGFFAGFNQQIAAYLKANKNWSHMDTTAAAKKFVDLEIAAHPDGVGPPVTILTVNRAGKQKWINSGLCELPPGTLPKPEPTTPPNNVPPAPAL
jgi:hypothetical protein